MNIHPELAPAYAGTTTTITGTIIAFCAEAQPVLQVAALLISIVVGILTAVWTWKKIRKHE